MMLGLFINTAFAQAATAPAATPSPSVMDYAPFLLMFVVVYFMILRPQMRQQKEIKKMISELKIGDEVVLASGLHGRISAIDTDTLKIKIAHDVEVTVDRAAVQSKKTLVATKLK